VTRHFTGPLQSHSNFPPFAKLLETKSTKGNSIAGNLLSVWNS
jgi:hypothetical protein